MLQNLSSKVKIFLIAFLVLLILIPLSAFLLKISVFKKAPIKNITASLPQDTVDLKTGKGEFVIANPTPPPSVAPQEQYIIIEGKFNKTTKKITIQAAQASSNSPEHQNPPIQRPDSSILLKLKVFKDNELLYLRYILLDKTVDSEEIPFETTFKYVSKPSIQVVDQANKIIFIQELSI